jgi:hypothetical protein
LLHTTPERMTLGVQLIPSVGTKDEKPADDQHEAELDGYPRNRKVIKPRHVITMLTVETTSEDT